MWSSPWHQMDCGPLSAQWPERESKKRVMGRCVERCTERDEMQGKSIRELSRQLTDRCLSPGDLLDQKGGERLKTTIEIRLRVRTKAACVN